jgi:hypothetical protein
MTELDKLLVQEDKGMENAENTPAKILRGLINDMNISPMQMIQLLNAWLNRIRRNGKALDGNERSNRRGNLIKEISRDSLTWNVFEKAIAVLDFDEWEISFKGKKNGRTYKRTVKYHIRTPQDLDQFIKHLDHGEYIEHRQLEEERQELAKTAATRSMARAAAAYTSDWITAKISSKNKF